MVSPQVAFHYLSTSPCKATSVTYMLHTKIIYEEIVQEAQRSTSTSSRPTTTSTIVGKVCVSAYFVSAIHGKQLPRLHGGSIPIQ